jgi:hypothetical protein
MRLKYGVETNGTILDIVTWQLIQTGFNKGYMRKKQLIFKQPQLFYNVETSEFSDSPFTWFTPEQLMEGADVEQFNKLIMGSPYVAPLAMGRQMELTTKQHPHPNRLTIHMSAPRLAQGQQLRPSGALAPSG